MGDMMNKTRKSRRAVVEVVDTVISDVMAQKIANDERFNQYPFLSVKRVEWGSMTMREIATEYGIPMEVMYQFVLAYDVEVKITHGGGFCRRYKK